MIELEKTIIGSCFGEDQFKKVSFLEPDDFTNYPQKPYREYFKLLKKTNAEQDCLIECLQHCEDKGIYNLLCEQTNLLGLNNIDRFALKLLEMRFKALLMDLLTKLSMTSKKSVERELLREACLTLVKPETDVFELSDNLQEYIGVHISDHTKNRLDSFLTYRDKRVEKAKQTINELR